MKIKTVLGALVGLLFLTTAGAIALMAVRSGAPRPRSEPLPAFGEVPDFVLTEASGRTVRRADLRGRVWLASFIFTRCATVCPTMMRTEIELQQQLPVRDDLWLVTFSVDPEFDTPQVLTDYAAAFHADRQRWLFLTGDKRRIWELAQAGFRLTTAAAADEEMPILHSSKLVLVDRQGVIRGYYDSTDAPALRRLARDVKRLLVQRT